MFFYQDVQWSTSSTNIGFNAGDGIRGFNLPRPEGSSTFVNVDDTSNTGFPGVYFFRVDQDSIVEPPSCKFVEFCSLAMLDLLHTALKHAYHTSCNIALYLKGTFIDGYEI